MKTNRWRIVKTYDGISTLKGWAIEFRGEAVAEFYGVPYHWVRKTMALWKLIEKKRKPK